MEVFQTYGAAFKYLRESRGMTIKKTAEDIVSPQFLSRFEKDNSSISLENFSRLLTRLGITWNDFFKVYRGESTEYLLQHLYNALNHSANDIDILEAARKKPAFDFKDNPVFNTLTADAIRVYSNAAYEFDWDVSEEQKRLSDYLNQTDTWGEVERSLYQLILQTLPTEMVAYRGQELCNSLKNDLSLSMEEKREIVETLLETLRYLSREKKNREVERLIVFMTEEFKKPGYLYYSSEILLFKMQTAYHYFRVGDMRAHDMARKVYFMFDRMEKDFDMSIMGKGKENFYITIQQINKTGVEFTLED